MKHFKIIKPFCKFLFLLFFTPGFSPFVFAEKTPRFNTFRIESIQAGSTTDIDNLKVVDLDTDQVVYQNNFSNPSDAKRDLNLFYYPQGGKDTDNFRVDDQKNRIVNGKLRLETTGYRANGRGGYNSHSEAEYSGELPQNFLVEFHATRLQWAGHFLFQVFYRDSSDPESSHALGGAFSAQRKSAYRNDRLQFHGEGSWFNAMSLVVPGVGTPVSFPAPRINLQHGHRLGISLNGSTVGFHVDGKLLNSGDVSDYIKEVKEDTTILPIGDTPFASIQDAIDAALDGDKVLVPPGTYLENLDFGTKQIVLESVAGPAETVLQAKDKLNSVVIIRGSTIRGFTITGGTGKPANSSYGSDYYGGGIYSRGESVIDRCIIHGNGKGVARKNAGTFAGGVYAGKGSSVTIRDSLLYDNYAWACGGAVLVDHGASIKIENSTIYGNDSTNFFGHQGGVGMANGGKVEIVNSIVWGNSGDEIGAFSGIYSRGTEATVSYSLVEGGFTGTGNISSTSPSFSNTGNVFGPDGIPGTGDDGLRLTSQSPVIGKAINESNADVTKTDLCGYLRVQGEGLDMGCYEYGNELPENRKEKRKLDSELVAYFPFDGDVLDHSGNKNHGDLKGVTFHSDRFGKKNSSISPSVTDSINLSQTLNGPRTISFWMKVEKFNTSSESWLIKRNTKLIGLPNVTENFNFPHCGYFEDGTFSWDTGRGMRFYSSSENGLIEFSAWNHITYVYTGSLASSKVLLNAKLLSTSNTRGGTRDNFADSSRVILLSQENTNNSFDDLRIYSRALSVEDVVALYEVEKAAQTPEEMISGFGLRMVEIDSKGPVALGYPKFDEIEVSMPKFKISGETVTFGIWSKVRQAAERKLGWELAEGLQGSGYDDTNENHPVTKIGFLDATLWCNALSKMVGLEPCYSVEGANGKIQVFEPNMLADAQERGVHFNQAADGIRLPTGNEWEVAARGGLVGKKYPWGNEYPGSTRANWYVGNGMPNTTTEVGSYAGNGYGLFDMAGGVWEMTWDDALQPENETPAVLSSTYVNRGGAWNAGWSPEVSTNGGSIRFGDRRHEIGFRIAANGGSIGKAPPPIGPPTGAPEPLVDYIKLLREIMEEIAKVESELNDLFEQTVQKDAEIEKWESELVSINREINDARVQLADCLEDCNRTREEMAQVQKETLTHNLTIVGLEGELRASAERLNFLRNDRDGMVKQITKIEKDMEEATAKLNTAHTPGWHYVPAYGWLWTSPEHYPLIYSNEREGWVYYERGTSDPWLYFDYNSEKWEQWFHDAPLFSFNN